MLWTLTGGEPLPVMIRGESGWLRVVATIYAAVGVSWENVVGTRGVVDVDEERSETTVGVEVVVIVLGGAGL